VSKPLAFSAELGRVSHNRCVDVPAEVSAALGTGKRIPVEARVLGTSFLSTLVPRGAGLHRLFIPAEVCRAHGFEAGDRVPVRLRAAPKPEPDPIAGEIREASDGDPEVLLAYARVTPADRRQIARWLASARSEDTRVRRLRLIVERLRERAAHT